MDAIVGDGGYEGWSNWHTWKLYLWITNDEQALSEACVCARENPKALSDWCHDFVWVGMGFDHDPPSSAGTDFVLAALNEVAFEELGNRLLRSESA